MKEADTPSNLVLVQENEMTSNELDKNPIERNKLRLTTTTGFEKANWE